ncbi:endophilin-B1-like [Melanotaenia boesemani]|uniref:endophilin-B1-like n=1 Tax=Melanotaenia boesemani TaxID=1250792 RepID=UPI001C04384F|nr:endophilin-B1-like [Melanotaenia boesemani]
MDLTRLAVDAGQFINRAVQYTGESLGQTEKTDLDPGLEGLLARADATKTWTDQMISQTEVLLQPSPGARLEDRLYEHLEWSVPPRPRANELLGDHMTQAGMEIGSNTPYGTALIRCGEAQKQLGEVERKFVQSTNIHFLTPLRSFTEGEYTAIQNEHKMLVNKRLDLDIAKSRLRKAHEADREARNLNANPLEDDYVSQVSYMFSFLRVKWLKVWAQEISQAEMELRICQSLFDRQTEIIRRVLEGISDTHTNHMQILMDFVDAQASYFAQCNQQSQELRRQLASIPAVFCSNNWQSVGNNAVNQPLISSHVANEPLGLDEITPMPVTVHQLPDFNQDSWTVNSPPKTEVQPNYKNNNNNIFSTPSQANNHPSAVTCSSSHRRTLSQTITSKQRDELQAPSCTSSACETTNRPSSAVPPYAQSVSATASINNGTGRVTTAACPPLQPNETPSESQTANLVATETVTPNGVAADP